MAAFGEFEQFGDDGAFGLWVHRQIGVVPVGVDAEAFQLLALGVDPCLRVGAAFGAEFLGGNLVLVALFLAVFLLDLPFDRQAVAIPAGDVGRVEALEALRAHDHVLEDMVQRVADVDVAIRIGRAIVEDEFFAARAGIAQGAVEILILPQICPARQNARLLLGEARLHGEIGLRQEDGGAPVLLGRGVRLFGGVGLIGHGGVGLSGARAILQMGWGF